MRKRAVHCLEAWLREGKVLRQKLPVLSGYMGHAILKSTERYLRLVPGRFVKSLSSLQAPPNSPYTRPIAQQRRNASPFQFRPEAGLVCKTVQTSNTCFYIRSQ